MLPVMLSSSWRNIPHVYQEILCVLTRFNVQRSQVYPLLYNNLSLGETLLDYKRTTRSIALKTTRRLFHTQLHSDGAAPLGELLGRGWITAREHVWSRQPHRYPAEPGSSTTTTQLHIYRLHLQSGLGFIHWFVAKTATRYLFPFLRNLHAPPLAVSRQMNGGAERYNTHMRSFPVRMLTLEILAVCSFWFSHIQHHR